MTIFCLQCLNSCHLPDNINETLIVLIPKVEKPDRISDLRPISLCNVVVKVMTKVLANRLKLVLDSVISESQSAFVPGRLITDNVLIAFEVTHYLHCRTPGKVGFSSLKTDMSKAYDRVEWTFLEDMMRALGFEDRWVNLVMMFVKSVSYSIPQNDREIGPIFPTRGLRQGTPFLRICFFYVRRGYCLSFLISVEEGVSMGLK